MCCAVGNRQEFSALGRYLKSVMDIGRLNGHDLLQRCKLQAADGDDDDGDDIILSCVAVYNTEQPSEQKLK